MGIGPWQFELARPLWLAALAALPLLVYFWRRSLVQFPRWQRSVSLCVRTFLVALLVLALCGSRLTGKSDLVQVVALVDSSTSVLPGASSKAVAAFRDEAARQAGKPRFSTLFFAGETGEWRLPEDGRPEDVGPDRRATDIARAIAAARAAIPANRAGHIVLLSDGNQTTGDALAAAKAAGVPISTVPLASCDPEVYVSAIHAPRQARLGQPFHLEVVIQSTHEDDGMLTLLRGSAVVLQEKRHLIQGENHLPVVQVANEGSSATFTATITGCKDTIAENNQAGCVVQVGPKPRALLVESRPVLAKPLAEALAGENIEVEVRLPQDMPGRASDLQHYDLLLLSNVPATSLPTGQMQAVRSYVHDFGGGLIVVGGDQSFTAGGYHGTALEDALPVIAEAKREKPKPGLAMVLVIDVSGSMKGRSIDLAKQATRRAVEALGPRDQVGVLAFEDGSRWIAPLHTATDKEGILSRIDTIQAGGGTNMYPAIERAYLALREAYADLKHIIVLTDGVSMPGDFLALTKNLAAAGITVSMVGVGDEPARPLLQGIAEKAKGHAYFVDDAAALPRIFEMETRGAGHVGITEEQFLPQVVHSTQALRGLDFEKAPRLLGYVETQARPEAQVVLNSQYGEPILAWWRYGKGTSVAFTSDIQSRWAAAWLNWKPGFGRFWAQLVRQTMRQEGPEHCLLRAAPSGDGVELALDATDADGKFLNGAEAVVNVAVPQHKNEEIGLRQVAPGRYAARFAAPTCGAYHMETKLRYEGRPVEVPRSGIVISYPEELRVRPANTRLLRAIAEASQGQFDPKPADVFAPTEHAVLRTVPLWPFLLLAVVVVFLLDLMLKRVEWK
jgi:Ca-activated chloride channel homolog